jgi:hypothetical protein
VAEPVISREEVVALLFAVHDIRETLSDLYAFVAEEDNGEEEDEN